MADESSELEEETRKPGRACEGSRQDLIKCLRESDCVRVVRGVVSGWSINLCALLAALAHIHASVVHPHPPTLQSNPMCTVDFVRGI